jgi:hypothetical protein
MQARHVPAIAAVVVLAVLGGHAGARAAGSPGVSHGSIGTAAPTPGVRARIRALGLEDDAEGGSDDGGLFALGRVSHGSIGSALPGANAAARIRILGLDD